MNNRIGLILDHPGLPLSLHKQLMSPQLYSCFSYRVVDSGSNFNGTNLYLLNSSSNPIPRSRRPANKTSLIPMSSTLALVFPIGPIKLS